MRKKNRKGQARMTETIAILFIFFVLILFGIIFYYKYSQSAAAEYELELLSKKSIEVTTKMLFLPELQCSKGESEAEGFCFDLMKLRTLSKTIKGHLEDYYFDIFSYSTITINETFPNPENSWVVYDFPKPGFKDKELTRFVISLRDESFGKSGEPAYSFGFVTVEVYS
tara:strand:+ start:69 stop:575 length:507 start_codon:yes stop_codon:yes gene_type:complete